MISLLVHLCRCQLCSWAYVQNTKNVGILTKQLHVSGEKCDMRERERETYQQRVCVYTISKTFLGMSNSASPTFLHIAASHFVVSILQYGSRVHITEFKRSLIAAAFALTIRLLYCKSLLTFSVIRIQVWRLLWPGNPEQSIWRSSDQRTSPNTKSRTYTVRWS